ncbi:nucleotidyl cyclase domain-containing protein [Microbacterium sp. HJ5]
MNDIVDITAGAGLAIAQAAIATLATMLTIGVAFLSKPSRATLLWSFAFALAMVSTFGVVAGEVTGSETIRRIFLGLLMGAPALLWSGFRALWGLRSLPWIGPALGVISAALLVASGDTTWFSPAYRAVFFAASVFAGLFFWDWVRVPARRDRVTLPFAVMSLAFFAVGTANAVAGFLFPPTTGDDLALVRLVTSIGMLAYTACALVAVVGISTRDTPFARPSAVPAEWQRFELTATDRLARARASAEPWSIVYLRLDNATELRQMGGPAVLAALSRRFLDAVRAVFPAEADVGSPTPGTAVVLVPRSDAVVRDHLRTALERISGLEVDMKLAIRPSASAGWAPVSVVGYDLDALLYMAREAATLASENGGDRWERVGVTVTDRLLNPLQRS